jgi:hypothetical protein
VSGVSPHRKGTSPIPSHLGTICSLSDPIHYFVLPPPIRKTRLYDPLRRPHDWPGILSATEVAIFLADVRNGHELTAEGTPVHSSAQSSCYVAPDLRTAIEFCHGLIEKNRYLRCEIFDRRGRSVDPMAEILHPSQAKRRETSPRRAKLLVVSGIVLLLFSGPLFYLDWKRSGHLLWPSIIAVNCIGVGFRLLYWGISVLQYRRH